MGGDERGRRGFNRGYLDLTDHFSIQPHTINRAEPHENGDIESANGAFKRRTLQHLLLRGDRDFVSRDAYRQFIPEALRDRPLHDGQVVAALESWAAGEAAQVMVGVFLLAAAITAVALVPALVLGGRRRMLASAGATSPEL